MTEMEEHLEEELQEFKKEKETIRHIVGQLGSGTQRQNKIISRVFIVLIVALLAIGLASKKTDLTITLLVTVLVALFKLIWMLNESQRTNHFQFWILSTLEYKISEVDKRIRKIEKIVREKEEKNLTNSDKNLVV
ncbi:hypothetical protein [Fusobacterium sp. PH5-44]